MALSEYIIHARPFVWNGGNRGCRTHVLPTCEGCATRPRRTKPAPATHGNMRAMPSAW